MAEEGIFLYDVNFQDDLDYDSSSAVQEYRRLADYCNSLDLDPPYVDGLFGLRVDFFDFGNEVTLPSELDLQLSLDDLGIISNISPEELPNPVIDLFEDLCFETFDHLKVEIFSQNSAPSDENFLLQPPLDNGTFGFYFSFPRDDAEYYYFDKLNQDIEKTTEEIEERLLKLHDHTS